MEINKLITPFNRTIGREGHEVEWIVLHFTELEKEGAKRMAYVSATNHFNWSEHFFVDSCSIWQSVELEDTAWHVGDEPSLNSLNGCTNKNSIGIAMCWSSYKRRYAANNITERNAEKLVIELLKKYPKAKVCRHYDVSGKICPKPWVENPSIWDNFIKKVGASQ